MSKPATISYETPPKAAGHIVRANGISRTFRMGDVSVDVLKNVNLTIKTGEFIAIEGRSGSGKSTLLHVLGALDAPNEGTVSFIDQNYTRISTEHAARGFVGWLTRVRMIWLIVGLLVAGGLCTLVHLGATAQADQPISSMTAWAYAAIALGVAAGLVTLPVVVAWAVRIVRSHLDDRISAYIRNREFGFVFQFYHLLPELDVVENTMLGQLIRFSVFSYFKERSALRSRAIEVLNQLGMGHRLTHLPSQLSGGERQRVAIARALMNSPRVLFADEPTGNLDAETGRQIMDLLERLHREQGQTIVMVTHDRALAREADRVLVLTKGKLEKAES